MVTEYFHIPYDEERLSEDEIIEIERFAETLYFQLYDKLKNMGLSMTDFIITKFSQKELDGMQIVCRDKNGKYCVKDKV